MARAWQHIGEIQRRGCKSPHYLKEQKKRKIYLPTNWKTFITTRIIIISLQQYNKKSWYFYDQQQHFHKLEVF